MATTKKASYYDDSISNDSFGIGIIITIILHAVVLASLVYIKIDVGDKVNEPIFEKGFVIELAEEIPAGKPRNNQQKVVENPPIINVPGHSAPASAKVATEIKDTKPTKQPDAKPSQLSDFGDVEKPVEKPKEVNQKALFQSTSNGDKEAENPRNIRDNSLFPGVGVSDESTRTPNTPIGPEHRQMVTASLDGRSAVGTLPRPAYNSQNQGRVVVAITVDQNGTVTKANARAQGSTVQDAALWKAAETAALKARFNVKKDAPVYQTGTITYVFQLN